MNWNYARDHDLHPPYAEQDTHVIFGGAELSLFRYETRYQSAALRGYVQVSFTLCFRGLCFE